MFGTNPVVFAWLPVFPCFRVFSIDRFNPLLSLFRVSFQWKRSGHVQSWLVRWQLCEVQNPFLHFCSWYVLLLQPTTAQILISLWENPCARNFLSQNTVTVEKLNSSKSKQLLSRLVPSRTQSCDRPLELRTRLLFRPVPRATSFPGFSPTRSVGRVGENPGNEVVPRDVFEQRITTEH